MSEPEIKDSAMNLVDSDSELYLAEEPLLTLPEVVPDLILELAKFSYEELKGDKKNDESLEGIRKMQKGNSEIFLENEGSIRKIKDLQGDERENEIKLNLEVKPVSDLLEVESNGMLGLAEICSEELKDDRRRNSESME